MQSPTLALLKERLDAEAADVASRTSQITAEVMPAAEVVANEVQDQVLAGDLELLASLVGKLGAVGPGGSGFKTAVDAALAKAGSNAPQPEAGNVQASLAAYEAGGALLLASLLQAVRDLVARFQQQ